MSHAPALEYEERLVLCLGACLTSHVSRVVVLAGAFPLRKLNWINKVMGTGKVRKSPSFFGTGLMVYVDIML